MSSDNNETDSLKQGSFVYDLKFLKQHDDSLVVLSNDSDKAQVIVSRKGSSEVLKIIK